MCSRLIRTCALVWAAAGAAPAYAAQILYIVTPMATTSSKTTAASFAYRYEYYLQDLALLPNQELDILFPSDRYLDLSNGLAGEPEFDLILFQPNNPPGTAGVFSAFLPEGCLPSLPMTFSVDFWYAREGLPGAQEFSVNQFDSGGTFLNVVLSGVTSQQAEVPEPGYFAPGALALAMACFYRAHRRRRPASAPSA